MWGECRAPTRAGKTCALLNSPSTTLSVGAEILSKHDCDKTIERATHSFKLISEQFSGLRTYPVFKLILWSDSLIIAQIHFDFTTFSISRAFSLMFDLFVHVSDSIYRLMSGIFVNSQRQFGVDDFFVFVWCNQQFCFFQSHFGHLLHLYSDFVAYF